MFKKKNRIEIVPESEYTDFSNREEYASKETFIVAALVPTVAILGYKVLSTPTPPPTTIPVSSVPTQTPTFIEPVAVPISQTQPLVLNETLLAEPTGAFADESLDMLANVLDPLLQIMVAISFPIASVIMVGACFFFMFGNSEKGWDTIMRAGLGYTLVQMSPLFLEILRQIGKAV